MRIAFGGFVHETNSFSPHPTTMEDFVHNSYRGVLSGEELMIARAMHTCPRGYLDVLDEQGHEAVPLVYAWAEPSGEVCDRAFDAITELMCDRLAAAGPLDGVLLDLHGGMIVDSYPDGEAEILRRVRDIVGDIPIAATLDLHGNLSRESLECADYMDAYRTYPHVDMRSTGQRAARALLRIIERRQADPCFKPAVHVWRSPFMSPFNRQNTFESPLKEIYGQIDTQLERFPSVYGMSIMMGCTLGDAYDTGPCVFAYADDEQAAMRAVEPIGASILAAESHFVSELASPSAVAEAVIGWTNDKPLLIADVQDNPGGGAMSDTNELLKALVEIGARDVAIALLFDPETANKAWQVGEGHTAEFAIGGKHYRQGSPLVAPAKVERLYDGEFALDGPVLKGTRRSLGRCALLNVNGVRVVICSVRAQCLDQAFFTEMGVDPSTQRALVVKSVLHYRAAFGSVAGGFIEAETPGALTFDTTKLPYKRLRPGIRLYGNGPAFVPQN